MQDNPDLFDYNVDELVEKFVAAIYDQKKHYLSNHIMLTMGSDFQYENAREVFKNLDKLMMYTMERVRGEGGRGDKGRGRRGEKGRGRGGEHKVEMEREGRIRRRWRGREG